MRTFLFSGLFLFAVLTSAQTAPPAQTPSGSQYGETLYTRSASDVPASGSSANTKPSSQALPATLLISDSERTALYISSYALEVHLAPEQHAIAVRAHLTAQNTSTRPLSRIALQISSALHWETIRINGHSVPFQVEPVASDIDHTGSLIEAVIALPAPLAPHASLPLDVLYSGTIEPSSERLLRLGAPENIANASEWDGIAPDLTALRGFGNVIWFPVSTRPVLLGQGSEMFDVVGQWKQRESDAIVSLHVLVEYLHDQPAAAFLNGVALQPDPAPAGFSANSAPIPSNNPVPRVASFTLSAAPLGFHPLSLFLVTAKRQSFPGLEIYADPASMPAAALYPPIIAAIRPQVESWLGTHPRLPVILVVLQNPNDLPFEDRNILFFPLDPHVTTDDAGPAMAHMLGHAYFQSPRPWLDEGVPQLMTYFWLEERAGRTAAIAAMDSHRAALALAETSDPGVDMGQSLITAWSDIYYRDKAADVLWMLRDIAGDTALADALQAYTAGKDREPSTFQRLLQNASHKDLEWFFDDWVYRDRGLPDLHILSAYRRPILTKNSSLRNYLVSVAVQNDGFCSAEVPVTVEAVSGSQTKRLRVPAHAHADIRMLFDSKPLNVQVNDGSVPEVESSRHDQAIAVAQ